MRIFFVSILITVFFNQLRSQTWEKLTIPFTKFSQFALSYKNPAIMVAGGGYGVWSSNDSGKTWIQLSSNSNTAIAISSHNPDYIFTSTEKSTDGGQSWAFNSFAFDKVYFSMSDDSIIYTDRGKSTNFGNTWEDYTYLGNKIRVNDIFIHPSLPTALFVVDDSCLYKSNDYGKTFLKFKYRNKGSYNINACISNSNPNLILITDSDSLAIYKSTNGGISFDKILIVNQSLVPSKIIIDSQNENIIYVADKNKNGLFISLDGGNSWSDSILYSYDFNALISSPENRLFIVTTFSGIFISKDQGNNFFCLALTEATTAADKIFIQGTHIYFQEYRDLFKSKDLGKTWEPIFYNSYSFKIPFCILDSNRYYLADIAYNMILKSINAGKTWVKINVSSATGSARDILVHPLDENRIVLVYGSNITKTTNGGLTWSNNSAPSYIYNFYMSRMNPDKLFYISFTSPNHLYSSLNFGSSWSIIDIQWGSDDEAQHLAFGLTDTIYLAAGSLFKSTDDGVTWSKIFNYVWPNLTIPNVALHPNNSSLMFCLDYDDYFYGSTDGGSSWSRYQKSPIYYVVTSDYQLDSFGKIYINGSGGIYITVPVINNMNEIPIFHEDFYLYQNYPEPFNLGTKIKYALRSQHYANLKVYDILGNEIETLVNEEKSAGTYEITWQATNFPSGVYFYRLQAGSFIDTKKMILLK